jgi:hypothetical protein
MEAQKLVNIGTSTDPLIGLFAYHGSLAKQSKDIL